MMIRPEDYYEANPLGRTKVKIMSTIRGFKQEIGRLKNTMESPDYGQEQILQPSEQTLI